MKQTDFNNKKDKEIDRINLFFSRELDNRIKNLSTPSFLGSFHLRREFNPNLSSVERLLEGELELKISKSLKNTILNPITKFLILITIVFNILWLIFIYVS